MSIMPNAAAAAVPVSLDPDEVVEGLDNELLLEIG